MFKACILLVCCFLAAESVDVVKSADKSNATHVAAKPIVAKPTAIPIKYEQPNNGCGAGWNGFDRPNGRWCLKVFAGEFNQSVAEEKCGASQAVLSAFMNRKEQKAVDEDAVKAFAPRKTGSIWLGLKRTAACLHETLSKNCTPGNSFEYTDKSTTGFGGLVWDKSQRQPDNAWNKTQACVTYFASETEGERLKYGGYLWLARRINDESCVMTYNPEGPRKNVGYLCGRKAK